MGKGQISYELIAQSGQGGDENKNNWAVALVCCVQRDGYNTAKCTTAFHDDIFL